MQSIVVRTNGDTWINQQEVRHLFMKAADPPIISINSEGPSLHAIGVHDAVVQWCQQKGFDTKTVRIRDWHNPVERIEFSADPRPRVSHFFWMSQRYRATVQPMTPTWALLIGHARFARSVMLWQLARDHAGAVTLSLMNGHGFDAADTGLEQWQDWLDAPDLAEWHKWWTAPTVNSIDGLATRDQYRPDLDSNHSIIRHYDWSVEIVAETFCRGCCFFPTEKTIRPLSQARALLVYGPKNFLDNLRTLGFETWSDLWDESYDRLEGAARWKAMRRIIDQRHCNLSPDEIQEIHDRGVRNLETLDRIIHEYAPG